MSDTVSVQPFEFQSDFSAPKTDQPGRVDLPALDFAALLAQARAEGVMEGRAEADSEDAARMEAAAQKFTSALTDLVQLAEHLEAMSGTEGAPAPVRALIKAAAQRLIDGQGELFVRAPE